MALHCRFCTELYDERWDKIEDGFFCDFCDGFTYFNPTKEHKYTLILEDKEQPKIPIPSTDIKFKKQLSPLRYPGGKSKLVELVYSHLRESNREHFVSPFCGGASVELSLLEAGVVDHLTLNDLDFGIYSLFWTILNTPDMLIEQIYHTPLTQKDYFSAQQIINNDYYGVDMIDAAWALLVTNRLAYSGIVKANPLGGRKGNRAQLLSRWNPSNLAHRIKKIYEMREQITLTNLDAISVIEEEYWLANATLFIDPPYVSKGKQLYHHYYDKGNHMELSLVLDLLYQGQPGADMIITYDYNEWLNNLFGYPEREIIGRTYTI
ncbi:DNA adenine methylase [Piscibacillus sp. B03]|uniref:DNA adenine methylase n=1 Tax=Piscibacillus sp. B03 TaxID=3457430 RepID=UPI003FCCB86D